MPSLIGKEADVALLSSTSISRPRRTLMLRCRMDGSAPCAALSHPGPYLRAGSPRLALVRSRLIGASGMVGGLSTIRTILGRPEECFGASRVASLRCTVAIFWLGSADVLALLACRLLRVRLFCRGLAVAFPLLGIRDGPTRTPLGTCVPTEVIRAHVGPPMVHRPLGFSLSALLHWVGVCPCWSFVRSHGSWFLRSSLGPWPLGFLVDCWSTFLTFFSQTFT